MYPAQAEGGYTISGGLLLLSQYELSSLIVTEVTVSPRRVIVCCAAADSEVTI